jgi:hypothetical protein
MKITILPQSDSPSSSVNRRSSIIWLHVSYWTGAVIDALAAILLTFPALMSYFYKLGPIDLTPAFRTADFTAASLMWGWTFLLLWADHKPFERRSVLLLTTMPVLTMMIFYRFVDIFVFQKSLANQLPFLILQLALVCLFGYSLCINRSDPNPLFDKVIFGQKINHKL